MNEQGPATAIIAAAGSGERLGAGRPKAFVELAGRPLLEWSLEALRAAASIGPIAIALPPGETGGLERAADVRIVAGGPSRSESVRAALEEVETDLVVVHDAARPLAEPPLFDALVDDLRESGADAVVAAARVGDTIKEVLRGREVLRTLDRSSLWAVQTPQAFRTARLRGAMDATTILAQATDDAMLVERAGGTVLVHDAPATNLKVTTEDDLGVAAGLLGARAR